MKRKTFLKKLFLLSIAGTVPFIYSWQVEPFWLEFVERKLPVKNLPQHLEGKILMQISDLHVGTRFDWNFIIASFQKAKKFNPDFVVYKGDFVNHGGSAETEDLKKSNKARCFRESCDIRNSGKSRLRKRLAGS